MTLWQWTALTAACGVSGQDNGPDIGGISIDTRTLQPGDLFIALSGDPGPRFHTSIENPRDGHEFIPMAAERGAAAVMVSEPVELDLPVLRVPDTLDGLWNLGRFARQRMHGQVAAITGSSGKTTARHWLQTVMAEQGRTHGSRGSLNNHWGVPLSLARMPADTEYGIFEVGMNHPGEIAPLAELVTPHVAMVLNVLPAHLGYFDSLEGIRREKLSIAEGLEADGVLVVPDDLACDDVSCRKITFGFGAGADVRGEARYGADSMAVRVHIDGKQLEFSLAGNGEHRVLTALAVLAAGNALGGNIEDMCGRLAEITTPPGRGNMVSVGEITIIDDSYNANPVSMRYALEALAGRSGGRRIALLGEMRELGAESDHMHRQLAASCQSLDGVITVGAAFSTMAAELGSRHWGHYDTAENIDVGALAGELESGDTLLVKGANKVFWVRDFVAELTRALEARLSG